jgi:hypothetical protein
MQNKADVFECPECGLKSLEPHGVVFSEHEMAQRCKHKKTGSACPNIQQELDRIRDAMR